MKKFFAVLMLSFVCLTLTIPAIAQATDPADPIDIPGYFTSLATVAGLGLVLTALITKKMAVSSTVKQIISWVICIALSFVGYYFAVGMFVGINVVWTIILGFAAGLLSNGTYDIAIIQGILEFLKLKIPTTRN